jgi:hypothetical protein
MQRHLWSGDSWLNFTLSINEEKTLDTKFKILGIYRGCGKKRPIEVQTLIELGVALLVSNQLVQDRWELLVDSVLNGLLDHVSNLTFEQSFEDIGNFGDQVTFDLDGEMVLRDIHINFLDGECWHRFAIGKLLSSQTNGDTKLNL